GGDGRRAANRGHPVALGVEDRFHLHDPVSCCEATEPVGSPGPPFRPTEHLAPIIAHRRRRPSRNAPAPFPDARHRAVEDFLRAPPFPAVSPPLLHPCRAVRAAPRRCARPPTARRGGIRPETLTCGSGSRCSARASRWRCVGSRPPCCAPSPAG